MKKNIDLKLLLRFIIPSMIGIILFMIPIQFQGEWTVIVKVIADWISYYIEGILPILCVLIVTVSAVGALIYRLNKKAFEYHPLLKEIFAVTPIWCCVRILGAVFVWLAFLQSMGLIAENSVFGVIGNGSNGGFVLYDLLTVLVIIFAIAGLLLPLLLDFGLLEFVGALLTKMMRPLFKIPGRAAVDCITSWIGDGTLGVMLTCNQYENGYYSAKEAAIIATSFSAVSITFSIVVLAQVNLMAYFGIYYALICIIGIVCAIICPRIPPLSKKKDTYLVKGKGIADQLPEGYHNSFEYGIDLAIARVKAYPGFQAFIKNGVLNAANMWFGVLPTVMCIGTIALVLANTTQIFEVLGLPFLPLLELLNIPEALAASKTMVVGFTDMFTPTIIAAEAISSNMTKFIVATVSVTQLIYLSEVGGLILASKLPVKFWELFLIFIERTVISLLIVAPIAHLIF